MGKCAVAEVGLPRAGAMPLPPKALSRSTDVSGTDRREPSGESMTPYMVQQSDADAGWTLPDRQHGVPASSQRGARRKFAPTQDRHRYRQHQGFQRL
jgi:hypothetical protein